MTHQTSNTLLPVNVKRFRPALCLGALLLAAAPSVHAQLTWDPLLNGTGSDGAGTWDASTANWAGSGSDTTWTDSESAIFGSGGTAGTVTASGVKVGDIVFNLGYTIAGTLELSDSSTITTNDSTAAIITATLTGNGTLTKDGSGTLNLRGTSTGITEIDVTQGTLGTNIASFGNSSTAIVLSYGAQLRTTGSITIGNALTFNGGDGNAAVIGGATLSGTVNLQSGTSTFNTTTAATIKGVISGSGNLVKNGSQKLTLTGDNTYTGTTTVDVGTLQVGNSGTTGSLGTGAVVNNATLSFNRTDSYTVSNSISGVGTLIKAAAGTMTMTGANTYTGTTTVSAGTLNINGTYTGTTGSSGSQIIVANGATIGGTGSITGASSGAISLLSGARIAPGTDGTIGTLTATSLTWTSNNTTAAMLYDLSDIDDSSDTIALSGAFTLSGTSFIFDFNDTGLLGETYTLVTYGSTSTTSTSSLVATNLADDLTGVFAFVNGTLTLTVVPEPGSALLLAAALPGFLLMRRRGRDKHNLTNS